MRSRFCGPDLIFPYKEEEEHTGMRKRSAQLRILILLAVLSAFICLRQAAAGDASDHEGFHLTDEEIAALQLEPDMRIAVVSKSTKGEFWDAIRSGMEKTIAHINEVRDHAGADKLTMTFEGASDERNVNQQVNILDAVIAENPDVLCLSSADSSAYLAQLEAAGENGIPVVTFDANVGESELVSAFCASDNTLIGETAAQHMAEILGGQGKVAVFSAQGKTQSIQERVAGFNQILEEYPGMEVVQIVYMDEVEDMEAEILNTLQTYPDLAGVFCTNADSTELYLDVTEKMETLPLLIGVDATTPQQKAVENGSEYGIVSQDPQAIAESTIYLAVCAADPGMSGSLYENNPAIISSAWIDSSNLHDESISSYLY